MSFQIVYLWECAVAIQVLFQETFDEESLWAAGLHTLSRIFHIYMIHTFVMSLIRFKTLPCAFLSLTLIVLFYLYRNGQLSPVMQNPIGLRP